MFLTSIHLRQFRNYAEQSVTFSAPKTILVGENAQGKSNLLEAVELISVLKSHRTSRDRDLVQEGCSQGQISATIDHGPPGASANLGLRMTLRASGRRTTVLNGETLRRQLDLLGKLNTVQFSSLDLELVRGGPAHRRDWLNGLLVQLEPLYAHLLQQYGKVLRQRNALLRQTTSTPSNSYPGTSYPSTSQAITSDPPPSIPSASQADMFPPGAREPLSAGQFGTIQPTTLGSIGAKDLPRAMIASSPATALAMWDAQLAALGTRLIRRRARALERLTPLAQHWHGQISGSRETLRICYQPSVAREQPELWNSPDQLQVAFLEKIQQRAIAEQVNGTSLVGPHRDEVEFLIDNTPARQYGSQGQQRTLVLSIKLAELSLIDEVIGQPPLLLLDDVLAELDLNRQNQLLEAIQTRFQTLITTTHLSAFDAQWLNDSQILTVQGGKIIQP
jgi:DNA replication and repair protein RecF